MHLEGLGFCAVIRNLSSAETRMYSAQNALSCSKPCSDAGWRFSSLDIKGPYTAPCSLSIQARPYYSQATA